MTITNVPLRVLEIAEASTKRVVFGVHIHGPFDEKDAAEVSTDDAVRQYVKEFCTNCTLRDNKLISGRLSDKFSGVVCHVTDDEVDIPIVYSIAVRKVRTDAEDYNWWMDRLHRDGGWADKLEYARSGRDTRLQPTSTASAQDNFWQALWTTVGLIALSIITIGFIHTMVSSFTKDD